MPPLLWISPVKLFRQDALAGSIFAVAALLLGVDLAVVGMRAYAFNGLSFSVLVAVFWHVTLVFLLLDLLATLLLPSRDLQEGAVIAFGIIAIMQIPLVTLYLKYELSWSNQV
ncbi:hypothetical protein JCM10213v2_001240 [Rhodosporidiobolus nylandii]